MILRALCDYYDALARRGEISLPGWNSVNVSFALDLDEGGNLCALIPLKIRRNGSKREVPQPMQVPERVKKTISVISNFLCESSSYFLGIDNKGNPKRSRQCFEEAKTLHHAILGSVDSPTARAICAFFETWKPENAMDSQALKPYWDEVMQGANLVFSVNGLYAHNDSAIRAAWRAHHSARSADAAIGICLVTGEKAPIARLHPNIKGIKGAPSMGVALVSFNEDAFESYGHEKKRDDTGQGLNSPVSEEAAFKYSVALNHLTADKPHLQYIGDTTVICWAEDAEPAYQDIFCQTMSDTPSEFISNGDLHDVVKKLAYGFPADVNGIPLHPQNHFFLAGLYAPNKGRLSMRFFMQDSFGHMLSRLQAHFDRLNIVRPANVKEKALSINKLLEEVSDPNSDSKSATSAMANSILRAILTDGPYPVSLFERAMLRIRAEVSIRKTPEKQAEDEYVRAAILKAFFLKNKAFHVPEEVLKVELNDQSNYPPYVLGRLFAVLEQVQRAANPGVGTTIKDRFFNSASTTPVTIFPLLTDLSHRHLRKLEDRSRIYFENLIGDLECRIKETLPARLSLADQGVFHLGYYHQRQKFFEKKDKGGNENV